MISSLLPPIRINRGPHFDSDLPRLSAEKLVASPFRVARHSFHPFLAFCQRWTKFRKEGQPKEIKERPIRSACRRDSYIFSHYRRLLLPAFEERVHKDGLEKNILAYRKIPVEGGKSNKCNIHFAQEAFQQIKILGSSTVIALDIKGFFDNLQHARIKTLWAALLNTQYLPDDHFAVFRAVTRYSYVDRKTVYRTLGYLVDVSVNGKVKPSYTMSRDEMPTQLCSDLDFRVKIVSQVKTNKASCGVPQGSPISDLLANLYMLEFDKKIKGLVTKHSGTYYRYSDDLLLILPGTIQYEQLLIEVASHLQQSAENLTFKDAKTTVHFFENDPEGNLRCTLQKGDHGKNGLEYLGFRFSGQRTFLRNSTLSGVYRRSSASAIAVARSHVAANPALSVSELKKTFPHGVLWERYGDTRVPKDEAEGIRQQQTFRSYVRRAVRILGHDGATVQAQVARQRQILKKKALSEIERAKL